MHVFEQESGRLVVREQSGIVFFLIVVQMDGAVSLSGRSSVHHEDKQYYSDNKQRHSSNDTSNEWRVDRLFRRLVTWDHALVHALSAPTLQGNAFVPEDVRYEIVHVRLLKLAPVFLRAAFGGDCCESGRTNNGLIQEVSKVDTVLRTTKHATGHAFALDVLAVVFGGVSVLLDIHFPVASIECAVKALFLIHPELEVAVLPFSVAAERRLRDFSLQLIQDFAVRDVAHLEVLFHHQATVVANGLVVLFGRQELRTHVIRFADITINAFPALFAFAFGCVSRESIVAIRQGTTCRSTAILAAKAWRAGTSPTTLGAVGELHALEAVHVAIETWRAILGSLLAQSEEVLLQEELIAGGVRLEGLRASYGGP